MGIALCIFFFPPEAIHTVFIPKRPAIHQSNIYPIHKPLVWGLIVWVLVQAGVPSRHWLYDSHVQWTEEGHRLSWRMMLRSKSGYVNFKVFDPESGKTEFVDKSKYLTSKQQRMIASRPDMCWQFVQKLKEEYAEQGKPNVEIYAIGKVGINGRTEQALFDPERNLAEVAWHPFRKSDWLLPLDVTE
ncbi:hypothetical protein [Catalinimonas niigatensis]|uniref:hypothetical protein n=1 Tax=Catalinimonas niigatensis TaxID=1397264 RepID=UPI0038994D7E